MFVYVRTVFFSLFVQDSAVKRRPEVGGGGDADHQRRLEDELRHKDELLARVKVLLQKAAAKEKDLLEQVIDYYRLSENKRNKLGLLEIY